MFQLDPSGWYDSEQLVDAGIFPYKVAVFLNWVCECGGAILMHPNLIQRRCSNPVCPMHMAEKADYLYKFFGYKNIGPATLRSYIIRNKLTSHFDLLNKSLYTNDVSASGQLLREFAMKQRDVYLYQIAELAAIPGMQSSASSVFNGYQNFEHYFSFNKDYWEFHDILINAEKYFHILGAVAQKCLEVMITGSVTNFSNRERFIDYCNQQYGDKVFIKYSKSLKRSADILVCDDTMSNTPKLQAALSPRADGSRMLLLSSRELLVLLEHNFGTKKNI